MTSWNLIMFASGLCAVFGVVYLPILMRQPKAFVSPYAKADIRKRASAAIADALLVVTCAVLSFSRGSVLVIAVGAVYLLFRDALFIPGQSVGKFLFGLRVVSLDDGRPCGRLQSAKRNFILLVPGLDAVAVVLETVAIARDPQGQRFGDILANTQVVEGLSAKELAASLQQGLLLAASRQRDEQPVEVKG